jgi:ribose 5-phosphate isomerase A
VDQLAELKRHAALEAVSEVRDGMRLGLGTGSTSAFAVDAVGQRLRTGELSDIVAVSTSNETSERARGYGIRIAELDEVGELDLAIDGADEVDPHGDLIKGAGGAILREKAVESRARRLVIIVDHTKLVSKLGSRFPLPVEVPRELWEEERAALARLGCEPILRGGSQRPFVTDNGNLIIDCRFTSGIDDPRALAAALDARPAVRAHGLFLGMASEVIVAEPGGVRHLTFR